MMKGKRTLSLALRLFGAAALIFLFLGLSGAAMAKEIEITLNAGQGCMVFCMDTAAYGSLENRITVDGSPSVRYDLLYAGGTAEDPEARGYYNRSQMAEPETFATTAYLKAEPGSGRGLLAWIYVRSGYVTLEIRNEGPDASLTLVRRNVTPYQIATIGRRKEADCWKTGGNVSRIPVILGGTPGSRIRRLLSDEKKPGAEWDDEDAYSYYEKYDFTGAYVEKKVYRNGKKIGKTEKIYYETSFGDYYYVLVQLEPVSGLGNTGLMTMQLGRGQYIFPKNYPNVDWYPGALSDSNYKWINSQRPLTPEFSPLGDVYLPGQTVTITDGTEGAEIWYLTAAADSDETGETENDGVWMPYTEPITLTESTKILAYAKKDGIESKTAEEKYIILQEESTIGLALSGSGTARDPWLIFSENDWNNLAWLVGKGTDTSGMYFRMAGTIQARVMMGTESSPFRGSFDGGGYTLTVSLTSSEDYCAPFRCVSGASFSNLRVEGTISTTGRSAAGLAGYAPGGCTVTNCAVGVDIISGGNGGEHAGFVSLCDAAHPVRVYGSVFTGSITGSRARYCAGFLGKNGDRTENCVYAGRMAAGSEASTFIRTKNAAPNCYYTNIDGINRVKGKKACFVTAEGKTVIDFGEPKTEYGVSGIAAWPTGLSYGGTFVAGTGDTVALGLSFSGDIPEGSSVRWTASAGRLRKSGEAWELTMPDRDVSIRAVTVFPFGVPEFILPADTDEVGPEAFAGIAADIVEIRAGCTFVGDRAFQNCPNLSQIRVPAGCAFGEDVFEGCGTVCVYGWAGSPAETYCETHANCVFTAEQESGS